MTYKLFQKRLNVLRNIVKTRAHLKPRHLLFKEVQPEAIEECFADLDEESIKTAQKYVRAWQKHLAPYLVPRGLYPRLGLCSSEEYACGLAMLEQMKIALHAYRLDPAFADVSALVYHHGLKSLPETAKRYVQDKAFIDAGAYVGDSSLVFLQYQPKTVFAFEPSVNNQKLFKDTMARNAVASEQVVLVPEGLSDVEGEISFYDTQDGMNSLETQGPSTVKLTTLDLFAEEKGVEIGFIKADLEGMGLKMLRGAIETIQRDRPVLSLSIYHNQEEFFGIYKRLKSLDLNYAFELKLCCFPWRIDDLTLIGVPQ